MSTIHPETFYYYTILESKALPNFDKVSSFAWDLEIASTANWPEARRTSKKLSTTVGDHTKKVEAEYSIVENRVAIQ